MSNREPLSAYRAFLDRQLPTTVATGVDEHVLALFHDVAENVPAYRRFLDDNSVAAGDIATIDDFAKLPPISKQNYIQPNRLPDLCRGGTLTGCEMFAGSSGSTGKPTFWPRSVADELAITARFEMVFADAFDASRKSTLAIVCFALGTWVGGMFTAACCRFVAQKGYPLSVVTPGNKIDDILRVVAEIGPLYDQIVLLGYPPFLKDVVDTHRARGGDWGDDRTRLVMAGEVFSEEWRSLICQRIGAREPACSTASIYGTADAGVLGNETPLSILIRRWLADNPAAAAELFGESRLPTLVQYDPYSRYFEAVEGRLLFTGDNGIPLIRYDILDKGGVMPFADMLAYVQSRGYVLPPGIIQRELPFVWVFGRSDFTVSYYGANIYPENVTVAIEQPGIAAWTTGKFVLQSMETANGDAALDIVVELAPGETATDERADTIARSVVEQLLRLNGEFASYVPANRREPVVVLKPNGDAEYFPVGVKHRYTRRG